MKRILFITSFLLFGTITWAQYTAVSDPNFENYLEENGMGDGVEGNGQVLTANIENVTDLLLVNQGISDLTGIEDFSSLESFGCSLSPLADVDLTQNTHLKYVGFAYTSINSLNLLGLEELEIIEMHTNNINSIHLGYHPNLTQLICYTGSLDAIDVTQCPALEWLIISENSLNSLDITQNSNLEILYCDLNWLTELDVSQNPNLDSLALGECAVPYLDLTHNPLLRVFNIALDDAIEYIDIRNGNNQNIQTFGATQCDNLKCIYVDDPEAAYMEENYWYIEDGMYFVADEGECEALMDTEEADVREFVLFPNPAKDRITLLNTGNIISSVIIRDSEGKEVLNFKTEGINVEIDVSHLPKGVYFVSAVSQKVKFKIKKLVKK